MRFSGPVLLLLALVMLPADLAAQGHGPVYGLSAPTLGRGGWSLDLPAMARLGGAAGTSSMLRPMVAYGVTEDVQLSFSWPLPLTRADGLRPARGTTRMPASRDVEALVAWRFHRDGLDVGARFETTAYVGLDYPLDRERAAVETRPGAYGALVTGYASRTVYAWVGGLYRRYAAAGAAGDRLGDVAMYSIVLGYRPDRFRKELPSPDWRIFLEVVGEVARADRIDGAPRPGSGGHELLLGPTVLGVFGAWGLSGGPLFPVYRTWNGAGAGDRMRFIVNTTFWF